MVDRKHVLASNVKATAGAVVVNDIPPGVTAVGVPARPIKGTTDDR